MSTTTTSKPTTADAAAQVAFPRNRGGISYKE
jgi:hypothetical protein